MNQHATWPLYMLAADHRTSLRRMYGFPDPLSDRDTATIETIKDLTLDALAEVMDGLVHGAPGILVDERFGAAAARRARELGIVLAMPVEASLTPLLEFEYGDDYADHVEAFDPDYVKVLVNYNPGDAEEVRATQIERLAGLMRWLDVTDRACMLEVLVPATTEQLATVDGDVARFDDELRPDLTAQAITNFHAAGIRPELWKLEGVNQPDDARLLADAVRKDGRDNVAVLVLGRGENLTHVEHWLSVAARTQVFSGFAIGRTVWKEAVGAYLQGALDRRATSARIAERYLHLVRSYEAARQAA